MNNKLASLWGILAMLALLVTLAPALPAQAVGNSPVVPVPQERWGTLEPRGILGDTTDYKFNYEPGCNEPFWFAVDQEGGYLFAAAGNTVEIYDVASNPGTPSRIGNYCRPLIGGFNKSDTDFFYFEVDAPPGDPTVFAAGIGSKMGTIVFDNRTTGNARLMYQHEGYSAADLVALKVGQRRILFVRSTSRDIYAYDLDEVLTLNDRCLEGTGCGAGVFLGKLPFSATSLAGTGNYLVALGSGGATVYNVGQSLVNPPSLGTVAFTNYTINLTAWDTGGKPFMAGAGLGVVEVFDLSCLPGCGGKGLVLQTPGSSFVEGSRDPITGRSYLYVGSNNSRVGGPQLEYFFDAQTWEELTPQGHQDGYWGWYYEGNDTGFNASKPWEGVVYDSHLYRAVHSFLDSHEIVGVGRPPLAAFSWTPTTPYANDPVSFTDQSTGAPTSWSWTFIGANVSGATEQNPSGIRFLTPGTKNVTLIADNDAGASDPRVQAVTVRDPSPAISGIQVSRSSAPVCSEVVFTADATGRPPLDFDWEVLDANGAAQNQGDLTSSNTFTWNVPQDFSPGQYRASVVVSGDGNDASAQSGLFTIEPLDALTFLDGSGNPVGAASYQPTAGAADLGQVSFSMAARGATRWTWDFGDDRCPDGFTAVLGGTCTTTDPSLGQAPVHQYVTPNSTYLVTVAVENCRDGKITSAARQVQVGEIETLEPKFEAIGICLGLVGCNATVGQQIEFQDQTTGSPDSYEVDWTGNGVFVSATPVNGVFTHTYTSSSPANGYRPALRVKRGGTTSDPYVHEAIHVGTGDGGGGGPTPNPSVTVIRSSSTTQVGNAVTFTAQARNCSTPSSWTWSIGSGGTFNGSSNTAAVSVTYSSAGLRTVTATANGGGCSGRSGSTSINVQDPGDGGGGDPSAMDARFTVAPSAPVAGSSVTFNGSGSTGSPTDFLWLFGDGATASGPVASHTYAVPGDYEVVLEISKPGSECRFGLCVEEERKIITVAPSNGDGGNAAGNNGCSGDAADDDSKLCLLGGQFQVTVTFEDPELGTRQATGIWSSDKTGFFWFFRQTNVELIVKVLDGGPVNGNYWVFYGALTNVPYEIAVRDLDTGLVRTFGSIAGESSSDLCGGRFTDAFIQGESAASLWGAGHVIGVPDDEGDGEDPPTGGDDPAPADEPTDTLELLDGRFKVTVDYSITQNGEVITGSGTAVQGTDQSGYFWFFNKDNLELVVKMVNGGPSNGRYWVFYGDLTSAAYTLTVEDTVTGEVKVYERPENGQCGRADTDAFLGAL